MWARSPFSACLQYRFRLRIQQRLLSLRLSRNPLDTAEYQPAIWILVQKVDGVGNGVGRFSCITGGPLPPPSTVRSRRGRIARIRSRTLRMNV